MSTIIEYLQSYDNYFWQYEDNGKVIAVPNGPTIGYSEHLLREIIFYLAPHGLPRFGSLLLAIAATNTHGQNILEDIEELVNRHAAEIEKVEVIKGLEFAKILTQLPARYKKGNLRLELLRGIFSNSHNSLGRKKSLKILKQLNKSAYTIKNFYNILEKTPITKEQIVDDFKTLIIIGRELDSVEAIMVRLTGLPEIDLEDLRIELEKEAEEEGLIDQLVKNNKTFYVGALVSRLISGLHIPFHSSLPSEQPLGGVADITNKGNFDKLLMSEFAYDDQILLSRLANNESLYHHREAPPADNNYARVILIDTSLKNWGTIRAISFASMLAIAHHPKNKNPCRVFLIGKSYIEIEFETVDDIIDGLEVLDSSLDPGVGLQKLFKQEQIEHSEIFYIGTIASLDGPSMQLFNAELGKRIDHWLHPNEKGEISVYKNPKRGKRFIQTLKLPLKELWVKPKGATKEITTYVDYDFPILFPASRLKQTWQGKRYLYAITKNRGLLRFYDMDRFYDGKLTHSQGWELITTKFLPKDNLKAVMTHNDLSITVLVASQSHEYALINYPSCERVAIPISRNLKAAKGFYVEDCLFKCSSYEKASYINLKGEVSEKETKFKVNENKKITTFYSNVYRNFYTIYIINRNQLRIGKQDLTLTDNVFSLIYTGYISTDKIETRQTAQGIFRFPDGSTIEQNRNGMLTLISSNKAIPKIYIPCVLNTSLGIATEDMFAGNPYYQMKYKVELLLNNITDNKLILVKLIKVKLGISLKQAKEMVDTSIISSTDGKKMVFLETELKQRKVSYAIRKRGQLQRVIKPGDFYKMYIQEFINHIVNHETTTN